MPYCTNCGTQVTPADRFCQVCGKPQQTSGAGADVPPASFGAAGTSTGGVPPRTAAALSYLPVVGWLFSIWVLASDKYRNDLTARFHAFQGLYLFVAWLIVRSVLRPMGWLSSGFWIANPIKMLELAVIGCGIFMMIKASQGERFRLPLLGEWADRSVAEQGNI